MITPKPLQLAREDYSIEEEDLFRRELENTINEIAAVLNAAVILAVSAKGRW